jgi:hypothetical protein
MSDIGAEKVLQVTIRDRMGVATDPLNVEGWILEPDAATSVALTFTKVGVGVYEALYTPLEPGEYWWRVETTGIVNTAEEKSFTVEERMVP